MLWMIAMEDLRETFKRVLEMGYLMSLATTDEEGVWVADVVYVYDSDLNIYWRSLESTRHSRAIIWNPKVAAAITANQRGEPDLGIQLEGTAKKLEGGHTAKVEQMYKAKKTKKGEYPSKTVKEMTGIAWYCLKPKKVDMINEELWEFEKKTLVL